MSLLRLPRTGRSLVTLRRTAISIARPPVPYISPTKPPSFTTSIHRFAMAESTVAMPVEEIDLSMEELIRTRLQKEFNPSFLEINDDSRRHGRKDTHYRLYIVSDAFQGSNLLARQRRVTKLFKAEMDRPGGLHSLSMTLKTEEEEAKRRAEGIAAPGPVTCAGKRAK